MSLSPDKRQHKTSSVYSLMEPSPSGIYNPAGSPATAQQEAANVYVLRSRVHSNGQVTGHPSQGNAALVAPLATSFLTESTIRSIETADADRRAHPTPPSASASDAQQSSGNPRSDEIRAMNAVIPRKAYESPLVTGSMLQSRAIDIVVGSRGEVQYSFTVHEKLIHVSPILVAWSAESRTNRGRPLALPFDKPFAAETFLRWLYNTPPPRYGKDGLYSRPYLLDNLVDCYAFGNKIQVLAFKNWVMTEFHYWCPSYSFTMSFIAKVYENTAPNAPLRRLMVDAWMQSTDRSSKSTGRGGLVQHPEFAADLVFGLVEGAGLRPLQAYYEQEVVEIV